jgi:hypothetical protein
MNMLTTLMLLGLGILDITIYALYLNHSTPLSILILLLGGAFIFIGEVKFILEDNDKRRPRG